MIALAEQAILPPMPPTEVCFEQLADLVVTVGGYSSSREVLADITASKVKAQDRTCSVIEEMPLLQELTTLGVIFRTGTQLGFVGAVTFTDICERGLEWGFDIIPAEAAVRLSKKAAANNFNTWPLMAMDPIIARDGCPYILGAGYTGDGRWLYAENLDLHRKWYPYRVWAFAQRGFLLSIKLHSPQFLYIIS